MLFRGTRSRLGDRVAARRRTVVSTLAVSLIATTLVVLAVKYDGSPIHDVDLNDGGVWVTNGDLQMMGRLNSQVKELDLGILTSSTGRGVFQEAASVQVFDDGGGNGDKTFFVADVVRGTTLPVALPATFEVAANRDTVAILDDESGRVWIRRSDQLEGFNDTVAPNFTVSERSGVIVSRSGTAMVANRQKGTVTAWELNSSGAPVKGKEYDFDTEFTDDATLTTVGDTPVVLQAESVLRAGEDPVKLTGKPVLQAPGPEGDVVHAANETGLWAIPLGGGDAEEIDNTDAEGRPAAPVVVDGCVHAAWVDPGSDNYFRDCGGKKTKGEVKPLTDDADLVFRTNRKVVVLNDAAHGAAWMVQLAGLTLVDNWESVDPNAKDQQIAEASEKQQDRNRNEPPTAKPDEFGARPGSTVILPVTLNDVDPDGDILTLTKPPAATSGTTFSVVGDGTQVQARVSPNATGSISFDYEISDGRAQHPPSKAQVTLKLYDSSTDTKPEIIKDQKNKVDVASGRAASVNVLPAWIDPEGDSLVLVDAKSDGGEVGFRPDGTIDFTDDGDGPGRERIDFVVRGGDAEAQGSVAVTVVDEQKATPKAVADHFSGVVGADILLEPTNNDTDPLGELLTVPRIGVIAGGAAQLVKDSQRGTATFRAARHGTYYLEYVAASSNGRTSEPQMIRVDVRPSTGANKAPIATRDIAVVGPNGSALIDVLANDSDADGDVLVVQGVNVPSEYADRVRASLINKRFLRVEVEGALSGVRPQFEYLLSDGRSDQVKGTVFVTQAEAGPNRRPIVAEDIVTARAGTIINVPVLENDSDPDGDKLTVNQQDLQDLGVEPVLKDGKVPIVATGSTIRVMVPDDGTTQLAIGYGARDPKQARADSRLVLNIKPDTPKGNRAPQPRPIAERTVTGQKVRVPVDVFGADPDGDPVVYTGVVEPPKFGRIVRSGTDWFEYEPFEGRGNTGTDAFKVQVSDAYGKTGTVEVRIGVAARSAENQAPAALDDTLFVKPGLTIQYPVMQNDSDPDGDPLILEKEKLSAPKGSKVKLVGNSVEVDLPGLGGKSEVSQVAQYSVTDGLGSSATAVLTVTGREDAPDHAPTTQDDIVGADKLAGKKAGDTVKVDVLKNDGDVDGARSDLELEAFDGRAAEVVGRSSLQITLKKDSQVVPYRVTDATDQSSFGFVYVMGTDNMPPMLNVANVPVKAKAGEEEPIDLKDVVVVRPGRTPKVARNDQITTANGDTKVKDPSNLIFKAPKAYYGPATVTLDVLDGENLNDPKGLQAQVTIPVTVEPAGNVPPVVRDTSVVVHAGGDPVTVDLVRLAVDPNKDDRLDFEVSGEKNGVATEIDDDLLSISANDSAPSGELELKVAAKDGTSEPVEGRIRVQVIGTDESDSDEPPMTLRELRLPDAEAGDSIDVDLREAIVFDPFPDVNKKVSKVEVVSGEGSASPASGAKLRVTPRKSGEMLVSYSLSDGSGEAKRDVTGKVAVIVADVPDAPGRPQAHEGGPDSVRLSWNAPEDNGRPIQYYEVKAVSGGGGSWKCPATQCVADGLDPGAKYSFTVTAVNEIGPSKPSPASAAVSPDTVPGSMSAPVIADNYPDRSGKLNLSWSPPPNEGSDITGYELRSVPGTRTQTAGASQNSMVWEGLSNGTSYTFQVRAVNQRGPGEWSPPSEAHTPFTKPSVMPAPTLEAFNNDNRSGGYLEVRWPAVVEPGNGYDAVSSYDVQLFKDGALNTTVSVGAGTTTKSFNVENGHEYSATVRATNRAGTSDWSSRSAASISWDKALAPTITGSTDCPGGSCGASTSSYTGGVRYSPPADNGGYPISHYTWSTSDGRSGTWSSPTGNDTVTFAGIGGGKSVTITPYTAVPGHAGGVAGTPQTGGSFSPFAKPFPPTIADATNDQYMSGRIVFRCDGNGRPVNNFRVTGTSGGSGGTAASVLNICNDTSTHSISGIEGGDQWCVTVVGGTAAGQSTPATGCTTAQAKTLWPVYDHIAATPKCLAPCYNIGIEVSGLQPGTYNGWFRSDGAGNSECDTGANEWHGPKSFTIGANGRIRTMETWFISGTCRPGKVYIRVSWGGRNYVSAGHGIALN